MSLSNDKRLEYLWKLFQGYAATSSSKLPHNESFSTYDPIFLENIWALSGMIPTPSPYAVSSGDTWGSILQIHRGETAIRMRRDTTSPGGTAWIAVKNANLAPTADNRLIDFVPTKYHGSYRVRVWAGNPNDVTKPSTLLGSSDAGHEWEFDYSSGVLFFYNQVPAIVLERGLWLEGWRYTGPKGNGQKSTSSTREMLDLSITTDAIPFRSRPYDVDLVTGSTCTLCEVRTSSPAIVECHSTPERVDTNPYRFVSEPQHLIDDGSYTVGGKRVFGPQFVTLQNMWDPDDVVTYWRVYNNFPTTQQINVAIQLIRHY